MSARADNIDVSLLVDQLSLSDTESESEANPNNNLMMRRAGLSTLEQCHFLAHSCPRLFLLTRADKSPDAGEDCDLLPHSLLWPPTRLISRQTTGACQGGSIVIHTIVPLLLHIKPLCSLLVILTSQEWWISNWCDDKWCLSGIIWHMGAPGGRNHPQTQDILMTTYDAAIALKWFLMSFGQRLCFDQWSVVSFDIGPIIKGICQNY